MLCPACGVDMFVLEFERIEIDWCPRCAGVWLDSGELALVGERAGALQGELLAALESKEGSRGADARRCPVCRKRLLRITTETEPPIVLDRCPVQHGLWFDGGELRSVVAAAGADEDNALARFLSELRTRRDESGDPWPKGEDDI